MPTTQQLKDAFNLRMKDSSEEQQEEAQISFWEVFDKLVNECGNQNNWTASTYEKFAAVRNHLKEFKKDVTFEYFNEFGLNEYVNFLRDKKDMRNSTIGKQMGFLKWFLRWSFKKGHHQNIAYDTFNPKLKTTSKKVIFLTWEELNKLKDYQIPHDKQYFICNALVLGIPAQVVMKWTGHSDYKAMKPYIDIADDIRANAMNKFNQL